MAVKGCKGVKGEAAESVPSNDIFARLQAENTLLDGTDMERLDDRQS